MRPKLLDLFCGAGGAAMGYYRAGFDVIGVDIKPQKHYPFPFIQGDALNPPVKFSEFDAIHASPLCQPFTRLLCFRKGETKKPNLVPQTRELLKSSGLPWVIENVPGAPLFNPVVLCGSAFGLELWRHRLFELGNFEFLFPECSHHLVKHPWGVYSHAAGGRIKQKRRANADQSREVMDMPWATQEGCGQAIPPAYTEFIGKQLMQVLNQNEFRSDPGADSTGGASLGLPA